MGVDSLSVRVFWPSTHASIPANWTRGTAFDDRFLQGDDAGYAGPANGGGVHGHTVDAHAPTGVSHTHSFSASATSPAVVTMTDSARGFDRVPHDALPIGHSHDSATSTAATITYQDAAPVVTISSDDALPPYMKLIVIKPDAVTDDVPDDAVCFTDETPTGDGLPTGFVKYAALDDSFVRAPSVGADSDLAGFGAATHIHTQTSGDHDHQDDIHVHTPTSEGAANPTFQVGFGSPQASGRPIQHHAVTLQAVTLSDVDNVEVVVNAASSEPAYIKLLGIQNTSGSPTTPVGIIVAFVGDADDIPSNWQLCDGNGDTLDCTNRQIKSTGTDGDVGDTGGSNTHANTTVAHGHMHAAAHDHPANATTITIKARQDAASTKQTVTGGAPHTHSWAVVNTQPVIQNETVTMSTDDGRSAYRTVVWIKKLIERPGPKALLASTF